MLLFFFSFNLSLLLALVLNMTFLECLVCSYLFPFLLVPQLHFLSCFAGLSALPEFCSWVNSPIYSVGNSCPDKLCDLVTMPYTSGSHQPCSLVSSVSLSPLSIPFRAPQFLSCFMPQFPWKCCLSCKVPLDIFPYFSRIYLHLLLPCVFFKWQRHSVYINYISSIFLIM